MTYRSLKRDSMPRLFITLILLGATPAERLAAQSDSSVVPGIHLSVTAPPGSDTVVFDRYVTRAGKDTAAGMRTVVSRVIDGPDGTKLFSVEQRFPSRGGEIVDTAVADLSTLRAVAHRSHQPTKTMRFDFVGADANGVVSAATPDNPAAAVANIHQSLRGAIFDSNVIDLVIASLPLDDGFSAELPFFIYERGGRVPMAVKVQGKSLVAFPKLGERQAWIVNVAVPGAPATIWVDTRTHAVLRVRYDIAASGMSFTDDRATPLRG